MAGFLGPSTNWRLPFVVMSVPAIALNFVMLFTAKVRVMLAVRMMLKLGSIVYIVLETSMRMASTIGSIIHSRHSFVDDTVVVYRSKQSF